MNPDNNQKHCRTDEDNKNTTKRVKIATDNELQNKSNRDELLQPVAENHSLISGLSILANTTSALSCNTGVFRKNDRLEYLKTNMPANLINSFNARDMNALRVIIEDAFLVDCQLRTSAAPNEVTGRDKVYQFFESYLQGCPDVTMTYASPMQFNVRVISFIYSETGTRSDFNVADELFDYFKHGTDRSSSILIQKYKYYYLRNSNMNVPFTTTSYVNFILNKEMTHVEKYIHTCKEVDVRLE